MSKKWDLRFLSLAKHVSSWSKDPSTKCGAILVRPNKTIASIGFNGFPIGMSDDKDLYLNKTIKNSRVIHAEMNAIHHCQDQNFEDYTLYTWPLLCCDRCAVHVIQSGIKRVVSVKLTDKHDKKWVAIGKLSKEYFKESGVKVKLYDSKLL